MYSSSCGLAGRKRNTRRPGHQRRERLCHRPEEKIIWPTPRLCEAVKDFDKDTWTIEVGLDTEHVRDITYTPEARLQVLLFLPEIELRGIDLLGERRSNYGGLLARVLENEKHNMRCLQYIYTYTRQLTLISSIWMILVPIIMGLALMDFPWLTLTERLSALLPMLQPIGFSIVLLQLIVFFPLLMAGLWPHFTDAWTVHRFRSTTMLNVFWGLLFLGLINPMLPVYFLLSLPIAFLVWWLFDLAGTTPTTHRMDYVPVFVWTKKNKSGEWVVDSACWDILHYRCRKEKRDESESHLDGERVMLKIDNPWHSLFGTSGLSSFVLTVCSCTRAGCNHRVELVQLVAISSEDILHGLANRFPRGSGTSCICHD